MLINSILITALIIFFGACLFPGIFISDIILSGIKKYSGLRRSLTKFAIVVLSGLFCTVALVFIVPIAVIGIVFITALLVVFEVANHLNRHWML